MSIQSSRIRAKNQGLTLIEVIVTLGIFVMMAAFMFMVMQEVTTQWKLGERRRALFEKAASVIDIMADDIRLAATREQPGAAVVKVRFIGDFDPDNTDAHQQRLMFVRAFEAGPERAITASAGDGRSNNLALKAPNADDKPDDPDPRGIDADSYTGLSVGDFKALGGMAMVAYFVKDKTLYRALKAPVEGSLTSLIDPQNSQPIATETLYLAFDYWGQETESWDKPPATEKNKNKGPQKIWDSTRGISVGPLRDFFLHRGKESLNDADDDVFPRKVRVTVTVDSPMPRCVHTRLIDEIGEGDTEIYVDSTKGFPDGGEDDAFILIDDEWMHFSKRTDERFVLDKRGARGTYQRQHKKDAVIRVGRTFDRVVFVPGWREDFTPDDIYFARKKEKALSSQPRRIVK